MINKVNRYVIYAFAVYPLLSFILVKLTNIGAGNLLGALLYFLALFVLFTREVKEVNFPTYLKYFLLFTVFTIYSDWINGNITEFIKYLYLNNIIKSFLILIVLENTYLDERLMKRLRKIMYAILVLSFVVILIQALFSPKFFVTDKVIEYLSSSLSPQKRYSSIFSWSGDVSLGFSIPFIISILISENYLDGQPKKNYLIYVLGFIITFLHKFRWVMISTLLVTLQTVNYSAGKVRSYIKYTFGLLLILVVSYNVMLFSGINVDKVIEDRILESDKKQLEDKSASTRLLAFVMFAKFFPQNPIFGTGGIQTDALKRSLGGRSSQIHVGFLSLFYYYGIVGGVFYLAFLFYLIKRLLFIAKRTKYWGSFYAMLTFITANLTLVSFDMYRMGIILAIVFHKYYEQLYLEEVE